MGFYYKSMSETGILQRKHVSKQVFVGKSLTNEFNLSPLSFVKIVALSARFRTFEVFSLVLKKRLKKKKKKNMI